VHSRKHEFFWTARRNCALMLPCMETLGLSSSTARTESRLKSLFWPSIQSGSDVDYLGAQGYWVCTIVAILSFLFCLFTGQLIIGTLISLFFYLGGVGVRERSFYAAAAVLLMYFMDTMVSGIGVVRVLIGALLISNLRATWIASRWKAESDEATMPPRLSETFSDKFADQLPPWLWPKVRIPYFVFSAGLLLVISAGLIAIRARGH
jgi:hypothetical protein